VSKVSTLLYFHVLSTSRKESYCHIKAKKAKKNYWRFFVGMNLDISMYRYTCYKSVRIPADTNLTCLFSFTSLPSLIGCWILEKRATDSIGTPYSRLGKSATPERHALRKGS
jgi:hypothetical protein